MGFQLAEAFVDVKANLDPFHAGISGFRGSLSRVLGGLSSAVSSAAGAIFSPLGLALGAVGFASVGGAIAGGLAYAVHSASDLNETLSKVGVVFGDSAKTVIDSAGQMAAKFGIPKKEFLDSAAGFGLIGKASGLSKAAAADLGVQFAKLGADAASFYNVPLEEALMAIKSGLVGEAEPLRRFGVLLNEAAVKAEALRLGIFKGKGDMTEAQKVQARSSLIMAGMTDASGDLERTQGALANRIRELQGRFTNLASDIGQHLLPVFTSIAGVASQVMDEVRGYVEENKGIFEEWGAKAAEVAGYLGTAIENPAKAFEFLKQEGIAHFLGLFDWLNANIGPAFDRAANAMLAALEAGFKLASQMAKDYGQDAATSFFTPPTGGVIRGFTDAVGITGADGGKGAHGGSAGRIPERDFVGYESRGSQARDAARTDLVATKAWDAMRTLENARATEESALADYAAGRGSLAKDKAEFFATLFEAESTSAVAVKDLGKRLQAKERARDFQAPTNMFGSPLRSGNLFNAGPIAEGLKNDKTLGLKEKDKDKKEFKAEFLGASEYSRSIQKAALEKDKDKTPLEQLNEAKEHTKHLKALVAAGLKNKIAVYGR